MLENPRRGRQARNVTTNVPKILDLKSSSEQIFSRKLPLGAPVVKAPAVLSSSLCNNFYNACVHMNTHTPKPKQQPKKG